MPLFPPDLQLLINCFLSFKKLIYSYSSKKLKTIFHCENILYRFKISLRYAFNLFFFTLKITKAILYLYWYINNFEFERTKTNDIEFIKGKC